MSFDDVVKGEESVVWSFFSHFANTGKIKEVRVVVGLTDRLLRVGAVILVVYHWIFRSDLTAKLIEAIDTNVDESLGSLKKIFTDHITPILIFSKPDEVTVSVLSEQKFTL